VLQTPHRWTALQLFDTLMAYFRPAESGNEQEEASPHSCRPGEKYNLELIITAIGTEEQHSG